MLIKSTHLDKARLLDFYQVMSLTAGFLAKEPLAELKLTAVANKFNAIFVAFDASIKQAQKTGYTDRIIAADDQRDNIVTGLLGTLRSMLRFPDAEVADAASKLTVIADKYGAGIARLPQREETAAIINMLQDFRTPEHAPLIEKAGLRSWIDKLDEANRAFDNLYAQRTEKEAEFVTGLTRSQRTAMQAAFNELAQAIEAYAYIHGAEPYKPLAEKINTEVANVQQAAKARATLRKNSKGGEE